MAKRVKIELLIDIRDTGEVVVMAIPYPIEDFSIATSKDTKTTATPSPSPKPLTQKTSTTLTQKKTSTTTPKRSKKEGMIQSIRDMIQKNPGLAKFLLDNAVDLTNLEKLTERQLNRAYALSKDYLQRNPPTTTTETTSETEEEHPYF